MQCSAVHACLPASLVAVEEAVSHESHASHEDRPSSAWAAVPRPPEAEGRGGRRNEAPIRVRIRIHLRAMRRRQSSEGVCGPQRVLPPGVSRRFLKHVGYALPGRPAAAPGPAGVNEGPIRAARPRRPLGVNGLRPLAVTLVANRSLPPPLAVPQSLPVVDPLSPPVHPTPPGRLLFLAARRSCFPLIHSLIHRFIDARPAVVLPAGTVGRYCDCHSSAVGVGASMARAVLSSPCR